MSESVLVALITMAAGVLGAGTGAVVTLVVDGRAAKRQRREEKHACYAQLLSAYERFKSEVSIHYELIDGIPPEKERDLITQLDIAHTSALLICGKKSVKPIAEFYNQINNLHLHRDWSGLHDAYMSALAAMRGELEDQSMAAKLRNKLLSVKNKARKTWRRKNCR